MLVALIPAYNPIDSLPTYVKALTETPLFAQVIVINDGSDAASHPIFEQLSQFEKVTLLTHAVNQGKGAALKTGFNRVILKFPEAAGVITIDADGQHQFADACAVGEQLLAHPKTLILGARQFDQKTPLRSAAGNFLTRHLLKWITGLSLFDTQSGLRGIPTSMLKDLLNIESNGYEFELDMLMQAGRLGFSIQEVPIQTIYLNHNEHSSFRPLVDSLKIYFVLFRFTLIAVLSALLDYAIFIGVYYGIGHSVFIALVCSRVGSITFNYLNVRKFAFKAARTQHRKTLPKYLLLACCSGFGAYGLITCFMTLLHWHVIAAKIIAEIIMFVVNFFIQRDLIFKK